MTDEAPLELTILYDTGAGSTIQYQWAGDDAQFGQHIAQAIRALGLSRPELLVSDMVQMLWISGELAEVDGEHAQLMEELKEVARKIRGFYQALDKDTNERIKNAGSQS